MYSRIHTAGGSLLALALVAIIGLLDGQAAHAMTINIVSFDASRSYRPISDDYSTHNYAAPPDLPPWPNPTPFPVYKNLKSSLTDPANFGPGGVSPHSVNFLPDIDDARGNALDGAQVLIVSEVWRLGTNNSFDPEGNPVYDFVGNEAAALEEAEAIASFIRDGGCVVIVSDTGNKGIKLPMSQDGNQVGNDVLAALDGGTGNAGRFGNTMDTSGSQFFEAGELQSLVDPSPVLDGPFGYTAQIDPNPGINTVYADDTFSASMHVPMTPGAADLVVGERNGTPILMEILRDTIDAGAGVIEHGPVLMASDTLFIDFLTTPDTLAQFNPALLKGSENNLRTLMNFLAANAPQHFDRPPGVPEPSSAILLIVGLTSLTVGPRRRSRRPTRVVSRA